MIINTLQRSGFVVKPPTEEFQLISQKSVSGIISRDFGHPYEDVQDMICGNLYLWLQQTYDVLWRVDDVNDKLIFYYNTADKLADRFATILRLPKEAGKLAVLEMVSALGRSNYIAAKVVFNMEGNWMFKYNHPRLSGLFKLFIFWLSTQDLAGNDNALRALGVFIKKFAKDIELQSLLPYSKKDCMDAFVQCFFHRQNEIHLFYSVLKNPSKPFYELC